MARRGQSAVRKIITIGVLVSCIPLFVIAYFHFTTKSLLEKEAVESGLQQAKLLKPLSAKEEAILRVQLSIVDYLSRHRMPPNSLADLVPTYFDSVPKNPVTKKTFYYKRKGIEYSFLAPQEKTIQLALNTHNQGNIKNTASNQNDIQDELGFINPNDLQEDIFSYQSEGQRDPFLPFDLSRRIHTGGEQLTPLERYKLSQLRLTAVLRGGGGDNNNMTALVEDAAGKGYTIKPGSKIGDAGGVVVSIKTDKLEVLETKVDLTGKETQHIVELKLNANDNKKEQ